jgi:hypothetical protein
MNEPESQPLAHLLGLPLHHSAVLRKLRSWGVDSPEKLIALAAQRGCHLACRWAFLRRNRLPGSQADAANSPTMAETNPHRILKCLNQNLAHLAELTLFVKRHVDQQGVGVTR